MKIEIVKESGESYLVNGSMFVPKADGNKDYQAVKKFIAEGGIVEAEFTSFELLGNARIAKLSELENNFNQSTLSITTALPHEMVSWGKQENQARLWSDDNNTPTPFIDALLINRGFGETKQELVNKIIGNADAYEGFYSALLGTYQNAVKRVEDAITVEEIEAIN